MPGLVLAIPCAWLFRRLNKDRTEILLQLQAFSVHEAKCFVESDRLLVNGNIVAFMVSAGLVAKGCSDRDALAKFDRVVQCEVPKMLEASTRSFGIDGVSHQAIGLGALCVYVDMMGSSFWNWNDRNWVITFRFLTFHLYLTTQVYLVSKMIRLKGWRDKAYVVLSALTAWTLPALLTWSIQNFQKMHDLRGTPWILILGTFAMLAVISFRFWPSLRRRAPGVTYLDQGRTVEEEAVGRSSLDEADEVDL